VGEPTQGCEGWYCGNILEAIESIDRAKALLIPYLQDAYTGAGQNHQQLAPFTDDAIDMLLSRSDGKPRDLLRKAHALFEHGAEKNWDIIDGERATDILDSLSTPDEEEILTQTSRTTPLEELWTT
jgi:hypothetical protein